MRACHSMTTPPTGRCRPTTPASTAGCSSASPRPASTAARCAACACRGARTAASSPTPPAPSAAASGPACAAGPSWRRGCRWSIRRRCWPQQAARMLDQAARDGEAAGVARHRRAPGRDRPPPAPHLSRRPWRHADRLPEHAAPAAGQAAADRHRTGRHARSRWPPASAASAASTPPSCSATASARARCGAPRRGHAMAPRDALVGPTLRLGYRPPYDIDGVLGFFAARGAGRHRGGRRPARTMRRTLALTHQGRTLSGWLAMRFVSARHELEAGALAVAGTRRWAPSCSACAMAWTSMPTRRRSTPRWRRCRRAPALRVPGGVRRLRDRRARDPGPAGHGGRGAHADAAPGRRARRHRSHAVSPTWTALFPDRRSASPLPTPDAIGRLGIVRQRVGALQALAARGGRRAASMLHAGAPLAADARRAARPARHRRVDRAADRDARPGLARCLPGQRHRRAECAGHARRSRRSTRAPRPGARGAPTP